MKNNELNNLKVGSIVENIRNNEQNTVTEVQDKKYMLDNGKAVAMSTMKRWYNLVEETVVEPEVEVEQPEVPETVVGEKPVEPAVEQLELPVEPELPPVVEVVEPVEPKEVKETKSKLEMALQSNALLRTIDEYFVSNFGKYITKENTDHIVVKQLNKKSIVQIYFSKNSVSVAVRKDIYSEEEKMVLDDVKILTNKCRVLNLKFRVHSLEEFVEVLERADVYTSNMKTK